jgi:hypothetical protein
MSFYQQIWCCGLVLCIIFSGFTFAGGDVPGGYLVESVEPTGFTLKWYGWLFLALVLWIILGLLYAAYSAIRSFGLPEKGRSALHQKQRQKTQQRQNDQYSLQLASEESSEND